MLKLQMDAKKQQFDSSRNEDKSYKNYIDNTVSMLGERDKKQAEAKQKLRQSYAQDLEYQIKEHQDKQNRMFNEMDERNLSLNQKGLVAYETGERNTGLFKLPGIDRDAQDDREYFGRYTKREPSKVGTQLALSHNGALSERYGRDLVKTSEDYMSQRRSQIGLMSPESNSTNILGQQVNRNSGLGMSRYKSMANIAQPERVISPKPMQKPELNNIEMIARKSTTMLSPRNQESEYEPTRRDETARRYKPVGEVRPPSGGVEKINSAKKVPALPLPYTNPPLSKTAKAKLAPASLQSIDNQLNQRILGSMRSGTINISKDNYSYGKGGSSFRG